MLCQERHSHGLTWNVLPLALKEDCSFYIQKTISIFAHNQITSINCTKYRYQLQPPILSNAMASESWKSFLEKFQSAVQSPTYHSNSRQKIQIQFSLNGNFSYKSIGAKTKACKLKLFCHCFIFKLRILQWVIFLNSKMSQETLPSLFLWIKKFSQVFAQRLHIFQFPVLGMTAVALSPNYIHDFL